MAIVLFLLIMAPIFGFLMYTCINETIIYTHVVSYAIFTDRDFSIGRTITEKRGLKNKRLRPIDFQLLENQIRMESHANKVVILNVFSLKAVFDSVESSSRISYKKVPKAGPKLMK